MMHIEKDAHVDLFVLHTFKQMPFPIRVSDVMSRPVRTISPDSTTAEAAAECHERDIGSLVVVEDGELAGIVTGMDLLDVLGNQSHPGEQTIREVMSSPVVTTSSETTVGDAVMTMQENSVARLVVLDDDDIVGLVSTDDIVRYVPQPFHRREIIDELHETEPPQYSVRPDTAYEKTDWHFESSIRAEDGLSVGDRVEFTKTISEQDVQSFATASGDTNRLHLEEAYAEETRFGRRIVHGTLVSGLISGALARLPGLTIYLSQDLSFLSPVGIGEQVTAACEVVGSFGRNKYELTTDVFNENDEMVIEGEATVIVDELPESAQYEIELIA